MFFFDFHGRDTELEELNKLYDRSGFRFAVVYGRRRVGKSTMINRFISEGNKPSIRFMGLDQNDKQNLEGFSEAVLAKYPAAKDYLTGFESWEKALDYIVASAESEKLVLFIDEYPYLATANRAVSSVLQKYADYKFRETNIMLILCGSSMSFMENHVLGGKSPLYGRRDMQFKVEPFNYYESARFFDGWSNVDKALAYGIAGGVPLYLQQLSNCGSIAKGVKDSFLRKTGALYEEPRNLLLQELREPAVYNTIIKSIATGSTKPNEIATKTGEDSNKVSKYLTTLISLHLVKKELPVISAQERNGIYRLSDNMFRFWYKFVIDNNMHIEGGQIDYIYDEKILPNLNAYMGHIFEDICIQFMKRKIMDKEMPFIFDSIGRWWGNNPEQKKQREIDIIASSGKSAIFGSCKWTNEKIDKQDYDDLIENTNMFKQFTKKYYYFFSRTGFTSEVIKLAQSNPNVRLITLDEIYA